MIASVCNSNRFDNAIDIVIGLVAYNHDAPADVFLLKRSEDGTNIEFMTYLGGVGGDVPG